MPNMAARASNAARRCSWVHAVQVRTARLGSNPDLAARQQLACTGTPRFAHWRPLHHPNPGMLCKAWPLQSPPFLQFPKRAPPKASLPKAAVHTLSGKRQLARGSSIWAPLTWRARAGRPPRRRSASAPCPPRCPAAAPGCETPHPATPARSRALACTHKQMNSVHVLCMPGSHPQVQSTRALLSCLHA